MHCPPILGIDYSSIATLIFLYSAWGAILTFPLGILLFLVGFILPNKPRLKAEPKQSPQQNYKDDGGLPPDYYGSNQ